MKISTLLAVSAAYTASAHYTFPSVGGGSDWQSVRQTLNWQSNGPIYDVTSSQMRCYQSGTQGAKSVLTVAAGSSTTFKVAPNIFHPGPLMFYMARAPDGQDIKTWDGSGTVWFKIYNDKAGTANGALAWPNLNAGSVSVTIPRATPSGNYLLRVEHLALHAASQVNGVQVYLSCAQITVTGGGSGTPGPLVAFPGAYGANDPGIRINIYSGSSSYTNPGPAVWTG